MQDFADFRILSAVADYDRERNKFFITFTLDEGEQYEFGAVRPQAPLELGAARPPFGRV